MTHLKEGDKAPVFSSLNENGETVSLSDFKGKKLILFFYPKDDTSGCTAEACNLRDNYSILKKRGFELLGVSPDSAKKTPEFQNQIRTAFPAYSRYGTGCAAGLWRLGPQANVRQDIRGRVPHYVCH